MGIEMDIAMDIETVMDAEMQWEPDALQSDGSLSFGQGQTE